MTILEWKRSILFQSAQQWMEFLTLILPYVSQEETKKEKRAGLHTHTPTP